MIDLLIKTVKRIGSAWKRHGPAGFVRLIGTNIKYFTTHLPELNASKNSPFDQKHRTDTEAIREVGSLDIESENVKYAVRYQPSPTRMVARLLDKLDIDHSRFTFLDFGAGKGRVLLLAGQLPFHVVIGIEFSAELQQIAMKNIAAQSEESIRANEITCVHEDVTRFPLPDDPLLCYFYNPFGENIMRQVAKRLEESFNNNPRDIIVLYVEPELRNVFTDRSVWSIVEDQSSYMIVQIVESGTS